MNLAQRLWIYQRERFPLIAHSILVLALTLGASGFATAGGSWPPVMVMAGAFVVALGCFLLLRIADEFKDAADDAAYRAYRPVPRGLVTLCQLAGVGIVVVLVQLAITGLLGWQLLPYLLAIWLLLMLMSQEFFVAEWLRARPAYYMLSHMLILPLIFLYPLASAWQTRNVLTGGIGWFLISSYANGIIFEIGRKLRAINSYGPDYAPGLFADTVVGPTCNDKSSTDPGPYYHCYVDDPYAVVNYLSQFTRFSRPLNLNIATTHHLAHHPSPLTNSLGR